MTLYEKYTADCKRLGFEPTLSPKDLDETFGVNVEKKYTPMFAKSSKKRDTRPTEPSLHNHGVSMKASKAPPKINLLDIPNG